MAQGDGESEPLVDAQGDSSPFVTQRRPTDRHWGVLYAIFLAFSIVGGIWTATHRNPEYHKIDGAYLSDPRNCPLDGANLLEKHHQEEHGSAINISDFMRHAASWLVISAVGSLAVGFVFLQLFKRAAGFMTRATIAMQIVAPLAMGVAGLAAGQWGPGAMGMVLAGLGAFVFYLWRNEIALCAKLLGLSAEGLSDNPGIIFFALAAQVVNAIFVVALLTLTLFAYEHGHLAPNGAREGRRQCVDHEGQPVPCCVWQPSNWAQAYMGITGVVTLWTVFLFVQMRTFVISGTIAQWYFSPPESRTVRGTTMRSVRNALGPQFGTLAFAAAVLTVVDLLRSATEQARDNAREGGNVLLSLLSCVMECIYAIIEFLTKFAIIMASIIGDPLISSGRQVTDLLARNLLKTVGVWWFPPMIVQFASLTVSAVWGVALYVAARFSWTNYDAGKQEAILLGALAFLMAFIVLTFFGAVLLNIVDALFVCYAIDRDRQIVTKVEVHEIYSLLPVGAVVEQPGGEYAYGNPQAGAHGHRAYVPPAEQERYPPIV